MTTTEAEQFAALQSRPRVGITLQHRRRADVIAGRLTAEDICKLFAIGKLKASQMDDLLDLALRWEQP
jgi:hypothetical protein